MTQIVSDANWLAFNLDPKISTISLPALPDPETQILFTGRAGRPNLQQAFDFYKFVSSHLPPDSGAQYRIVDFGGGWGRILRFFLRDVASDRLVLTDCLNDAIECAKSLSPTYKIIKNEVNPPLPIGRSSVDAFYAFSVFSHLNERATRNWLAHFSELLTNGGKVFITTRGSTHIDSVQSIQNGSMVSSLKGAVKKLIGRGTEPAHIARLRTELPSADIIRTRLDRGEFQFYPMGGKAELSDDFYGETWIPEKWVTDNCRSLGFRTYERFSEFGTIDQCIFVLTK